MKSRTLWMSLTVAALCSVAAWGQQEKPGREDEQQEEPDREDRSQPAKRIPTDGFWPTPLMFERAIDRMTEDLQSRYEFDDDQVFQTRELIKKRLPKWLNANRAEIQTLVNQFFEAQLNDEAPSIEHVAEWSQRVLPLVDEFQNQIGIMTNEMREFMTDDQQDTLDGELAAMNTGLGFTKNKLTVWADGGYDPELEWRGSRRERRRIDREERKLLEAEMEAARQKALADAGRSGPPTGEALNPATHKPAAKSGSVDEWAAYVATFKRRYNLNDDQSAKADSFLKAQQDNRDGYLRRNADKMKQITNLYGESATHERAQKAYARLNVPIERMFRTLKQKLDKLPTRAQRKVAARSASRAGVDEKKTGRP